MTRSIVIRFEDGSVKRITIPENWTVTFSSFIPKMNERGYSHGTPSLRVYGPRKVQMACFVGVSSFRDERVNLQEITKSATDDLYWKSQELADAPVLEDILREDKEAEIPW